MSCRFVHFGGRPGFLPRGSSGSSTAHCASVRSARPVTVKVATRSPCRWSSSSLTHLPETSSVTAQRHAGNARSHHATQPTFETRPRSPGGQRISGYVTAVGPSMEVTAPAPLAAVGWRQAGGPAQEAELVRLIVVPNPSGSTRRSSWAMGTLRRPLRRDGYGDSPGRFHRTIRPLVARAGWAPALPSPPGCQQAGWYPLAAVGWAALGGGRRGWEPVPGAGRRHDRFPRGGRKHSRSANGAGLAGSRTGPGCPAPGGHRNHACPRGQLRRGDHRPRHHRPGRARPQPGLASGFRRPGHPEKQAPPPSPFAVTFPARLPDGRWDFVRVLCRAGDSGGGWQLLLRWYQDLSAYEGWYLIRTSSDRARSGRYPPEVARLLCVRHAFRCPGCAGVWRPRRSAGPAGGAGQG